METQALRAALGRFVTGVTIVTCLDGQGQPVGLTVNSFQALSLEPPLVLWSLRKESSTLEAFTQARHFAVNVLAEVQLELSHRFASRVEHKFEGGPWLPGLHGVPVLAGCAAVFECESTSQHAGGDHVIIIGRVRSTSTSAQAPLLYHAGQYHSLGDAL